MSLDLNPFLTEIKKDNFCREIRNEIVEAFEKVTEVIENNNVQDLNDFQKKEDTTLNTNNKEIVGAINEVHSQFENIVNLIESGNNVEPQLMDMPRIYFSEGTLPTSKTSTTMKFDYYSKTKEEHGYVDIKCQGNSSMGYNKKNFTIKIYSDKEKTAKKKMNFKGWGKQSKFVLKANWIDISHARNIVSARLWADVVKSRTGYANLSELLKTSPNQGAVDGFPVIVYSNGVYQGRYTLNIPKDKWMSNMDDTLDTHCILCGENYYSGCFLQSANINGSDWTDELHDTVPDSIKTRWNECISFVMNSTDEEFKANLSNYFDIESIIDYLLFGIVSCGLDAFGKNQIYFTYDGQKWIASMYDMDSTWGLWWNGSKFVATDYSREQFQDMAVASDCTGEGNKLYVRLQKLFIDELKARYTELRKDILSASHIIQRFEEFVQICPNDVVKEDYANTTGDGKFTGIPSTTTNNIQQLRSYINARLTYVDSYINSLVEPIACTGITLNNTSLEFTDTNTQTLTATVSPTNTTEAITWSSDDTSIAIVDNGVVTPVANGNCVITVTCGNQSATCNIAVSNIIEESDEYVTPKNENLFKTVEPITGGFYNESGIWTTDGTYQSTGYIRVHEGDNWIRGKNGNIGAGCYWDKNKNFVSSFNYLTMTGTVLSTARYVTFAYALRYNYKDIYFYIPETIEHNIQTNVELFTNVNAANGYYINGTDDTLVADDAYSYSDYIEIEPEIIISSSNVANIIIYDKDKDVIGASGGQSLYSVPIFAKYMRINYLTANADNVSIKRTA